MSCVIYHNGVLAADRRILLDWRYGPHGHVNAQKLFVSSRKDFAAAFLGYQLSPLRWPGIESALRGCLLSAEKDSVLTLDDEVFNSISMGITMFVMTKTRVYYMGDEDMGKGAVLQMAHEGLPVGSGTGYPAARIACQETNKTLGEVIELVAELDSTVSKEHDVVYQSKLKPLFQPFKEKKKC